MRSLNNFILLGECITRARNCDIKSEAKQGEYYYNHNHSEVKTDLFARTGNRNSCESATFVGSETTITREMSRRKQFKPRHLDSDEGEITGDTNCTIENLGTGQAEDRLSDQDHPGTEGLKGLNPESVETSELEGKGY